VDPIVLFKITVLHARSVPETGLRVRQRGQEAITGTMVAILDDSAPFPANMGVVDLASGAITLRWAVIATFPYLADAFASGRIPPKDSGVVRVSLEESGQVLDDGTGFNVQGTGQVAPGSIFSQAKVDAHVNFVQFVDGSGPTLKRAFTHGDPVRCVLVPDSCYLDITLPKALGGGSQRLSLVGGFTLLPLVTLRRTEGGRRGRR
jgi:hypothetical protein